MTISKDVRGEFPELDHLVHLNSAAISLIPMRSRRALEEGLKDSELANEKWQENREKREYRTRINIAKMINASHTDIGIVTNTSEGINIVAQGIDWKKGDNVVLTDVEFPGNVLPWMYLEKRGVSVEIIKTEYGSDPTEKIFSAVNEKTRVVSVSFVGWIDGFKYNLDDIGRFCYERNIILAVDAIQGLGAMKIDVQSSNISFLSAGGFKWLLSPPGVGFMYINKSLLPQIEQKYAGYLSDASEAEDFNFKMNLKKDIMRFRLGSINYPGIAAFEKSLEMILELGIDEIQNHILELNAYAANKLKEKDYFIISALEPENRSGILTFGGKNIHEKYDRLIEKNIITSYRREWIRISPHFYNNEDDINRFLEEM